CAARPRPAPPRRRCRSCTRTRTRRASGGPGARSGFRVRGSIRAGRGVRPWAAGALLFEPSDRPHRPKGSLSSMPLEPLRDGHGRLIGDLRVSVTDRCNFRCQYCMPAEGLPWLARAEILRFEEIERIVSLLAAMGVRDVRLTGGEPLVRRDFPRLAQM